MSDPLMDRIPPDGKTSGETAGKTTSMSEDNVEALLLANARTGSCPSPDLLFAAEEDVLPTAAGASIREHAAHCALCQALLTEPAFAQSDFPPGADARIRARIQVRIDESQSSLRGTVATHKPTFWLAIAAVAAVVVIGSLGFVGYRLHRSATSQSAVAANHPPAQPTFLPSDLPELRQIAPLTPPDDIPALVTRGASSIHGPSVRDLMPAFRAYNRKDFGQAAAAFASLTERFPQSDVPPLYLGVSQLQLQQNSDAQGSLARAYALAGSAHHAAAAWYLAVADLRLGQSKAAAPLLRELCARRPNPYAPRACALAQRIGPS